MDSTKIRLVKRLALALAAGGALSGCVYAPPYAGYDAPYGYGPSYVGPPVSLDLNYSEYRYRGDRGWRGDRRGWRDRH